MSKGAALIVRGLDARYGAAEALRDAEFDVAAGEVIAILGRNGAGKSTLLKAILGLVESSAAELTIDGQDLTALKRPEQRVRAGIAYVPEERRIFSTMTVRENLQVACRARENESRMLREVEAIFPVLRERAGAYGDQLSGGEQQMLAIARALMSEPRVLLIDEPCEGLAPSIVNVLGEGLSTLAEQGRTIVLVEQSLRLAPRFAHRAVVLTKGSVTWAGKLPDLLDNPKELERLLGVTPDQATPRFTKQGDT